MNNQIVERARAEVHTSVQLYTSVRKILKLSLWFKESIPSSSSYNFSFQIENTTIFIATIITTLDFSPTARPSWLNFSSSLINIRIHRFCNNTCGIWCTRFNMVMRCVGKYVPTITYRIQVYRTDIKRDIIHALWPHTESILIWKARKLWCS